MNGCPGRSEATAIAWARRYPRSASSNLFVRSHTRARLFSVLARSGWRDPRLSSCMAAASRNSRLRSKLSRDAGRYLCNYVYWRALEAASRSGTPLAQFIHIPWVPIVRRRPGRKPRMSHAALARAGEAILLALLATQRR